MTINIKINFNFFKPKKNKIMIFNPLHHPNIQIFFSYRTKTWCIGRRHYSESMSQNVFENLNPKTNKIVEVMKCTCNNCERNKSQIFTE